MTKQDGGAAFPGKKRLRAEDVLGLTDDELVSVGLDLLGDMARIRQDLEIAKSDAAQGVRRKGLNNILPIKLQIEAQSGKKIVV